METPEALIESIKLYELQLGQVIDTIEKTGEGAERSSLLSLKEDLEELLSLTRENLDSLQRPSTEERLSHTTPAANQGGGALEKKSEDPLVDEYELFKAELAALEEGDTPGSNEERNVSFKTDGDHPNDEVRENGEDNEDNDDSDDDDSDIQSELNSLLGSKCQAPYVSRLGSHCYHNALISAVEIDGSSVSDISDIKVRVLFTNPTEKAMIPCRYFLDNRCNFGEDRCKYSHGNLVPLSVLQEFKEPDFKLIKAGCHVLVKTEDEDGLWKPAVVEDVVSDETCAIKIGGRFTEVPVHHILPLTESSSKDVGGSSDLSDTEDNEDYVHLKDSQTEYLVEKSLTREQQPSTKLGEWEKYTKGIGSRLMAKMGYVVGCGLGKEGDGRLDPVEALVLPAGKSLDHCMNLKEAAGGSTDLFSAERIQRRLAQKELRKSQRRYANEKKQEKHNVFNIINKLSSGGIGENKGHLKSKKGAVRRKLSETSGRQLNVERLKLEEDMRSARRDIYILEESLSRHRAGTTTHDKLTAKLGAAHRQLGSLRAADESFAREQNLRHTKRKMTIF